MLRRLFTPSCLLIATSFAACGTSSRNELPDSTSGGNGFGGNGFGGNGSLIHAGQSGALASGGADNAGQAGSGEAGMGDGGADNCGDGVLSPSEACDDGNLVPSDGCSAHCRPERGYACTGEPSDCRTVCGDGIVAGNESCDDGNQSNADSCINDCQRPILSVGGAVSCVLLSGTAKCWGASAAGQLGIGTFDFPAHSVPVSVQGLSNGVQIASSTAENCALLGDGSVSCWGNGSYGQLGNGQHYVEGGTDPAAQGVALPTPTLQPPHVLQIGTSGQTACALNTDGTVDCWGDNRSGQLGIGYFEPNVIAYHWAPERVVNLDHVSQIAVGGHHACALISDGSVRCWGEGFDGKLGDGQHYDADPWGQASPVPVQSLNDAIQVTAGENHTCALRRDHTVWCWGDDLYGELGDGQVRPADARGVAVPTQVAGLTDVVQVSAGENDTCVRLRDGSLRCWGDGHLGQLGDGIFHLEPSDNPGSVPTPVKVVGIDDAIEIAAGGHACAVTSSHKVLCWGIALSGQLGDGLTDFQKPMHSAVPKEVVGF